MFSRDTNLLIVLLGALLTFVTLLPFFTLPGLLDQYYDEEVRLVRSIIANDGGLAAAGGDPDDDGRAVLPSSDGKGFPDGAVPLVVGGTDGSGTRSVVCLLDALGVPVLPVNERTLDFEARQFGSLRVGRNVYNGWPTVVRPVLERTRTPAFDPADLPADLLEDVHKRLSRVWSVATTKGRNARASVGERASASVSWGIKAPVSMLILPLLRGFEKTSGFRFLHVVRDGRDIAHSGNQSPVNKFYNITFPPEKDDGGHWREYEKVPEARGMELWSLWNSQILRWGQREAELDGRGGTFDYMLLHIEDLAARGLEARQAAIQKVARFVGSQLSSVEICCLAISEQVSLGSHTKEDRGTAVESRFGKWKNKASAATVKLLNKVGDDGLKAFGYEPYERPSDLALPPVEDMACTKEFCNALLQKQPSLAIHKRLCSDRKEDGRGRRTGFPDNREEIRADMRAMLKERRGQRRRQGF